MAPALCVGWSLAEAPCDIGSHASQKGCFSSCKASKKIIHYMHYSRCSFQRPWKCWGRLKCNLSPHPISHVIPLLWRKQSPDEDIPLIASRRSQLPGDLLVEIRDRQHGSVIWGTSPISGSKSIKALMKAFTTYKEKQEMKREAERIKVQTKFSEFQHQYSFYKTKRFESFFFMKRKACFIDWWKLYVNCMIWSIISKLFLNFSLWRVSVGSLGNSQSLTTSQLLPPLWKTDKGHKHGCVLLIQPVPNTPCRKRHGQHDVHQGLWQARMIFHLC